MAVRPDDLRAGDVLLLRSAGRTAWAVRCFDGAEVDHAALVLGDGRVAEVIDGAPAQRTIEECLASAEHVLARRLKEAAPMEPVLARATRALRETRACGRSEVLLALLACARKHRSTPSVRTAQRACLEAGATAVPSPEPLTAAQFVWRCYEDALPEPSDVYTLHLNDLHNLEVVAGVPAEPGAGVARRMGRGVHPQSLLAWASQPLVRGRVGAATTAEPPLALDDALARYQADILHAVPVAQPARAEADALSPRCSDSPRPGAARRGRRSRAALSPRSSKSSTAALPTSAPQETCCDAKISSRSDRLRLPCRRLRARGCGRGPALALAG